MTPYQHRMMWMLAIVVAIGVIGLLWFLSESDPCYALHGSCG